MKYELRDLCFVAIAGLLAGLAAGGSTGAYYGWTYSAADQVEVTKLKIENAEMKSFAQGYEAGKGGVIGKDKNPKGATP